MAWFTTVAEQKDGLGAVGLVITFDTLAYSKVLKNSGMDAVQAEALAEAQKVAMAEMVHAKDLATQTDIVRLEANIEKYKHETVRWLMGMFMVQMALIIAVLAYLK